MPSTPVTINGLTVGKVQEIKFAGDGSGKLSIKMVLESDFEFSKNSKAQLYEAGLIGGKAIAIIPAFDGDDMAKSGAVLTGSVKAGLSELVNQRLTPLQEKMEKVMVSADTLLRNINSILDPKTKTSLKGSITGLEAIVTNFKETSSALDILVLENQEKLNRTVSNVEAVSSNLSNITDSIAKADVSKTIRSVEATISNFNTLLLNLENGQGTVGKLLKDETVYNNLENATKELEALLRDIKLHPNRYRRILSKKEIPYQEN